MVSQGVLEINTCLLFRSDLLSDYGYLDNRKVKWMVDRIDIDFE